MEDRFEYTDTDIAAADSVGHVLIADDVIAVIAAFAAMETRGVSSLAGNITSELIGKLARKLLQRGVRIETDEDGVVRAQLSINLEYGFSIPQVCAQVQDRVKASIENMTGLSVAEVNIQVAGVNIDNSK